MNVKSSAFLAGATFLIAALSLTSFCQEIDPSLDLPINPRFDIPSEKKPEVETRRSWGGSIASVPSIGSTDVERLDPKDEPPAPPPTPEPFPVFFGEEIGSYKLILVVDVSGSMFPGRIKVLRQEAERMIQGFSKVVIFDVVAFSQTDQRGTEFKVLWPRNASEEHEGMREATPANKQAAIDFINSFTFGGNTPTFQGVKAALDFIRNNRVVLFTDGEPTSWVPWKELEYDPRNAPNMVPGIPGLAKGEPQNMAAGVDDANASTSIAGGMRQQWYMICRENHVLRPAKGGVPARIDVFGVIDYNNIYHNVLNMKWFCRHVAQDNFGVFTELSIPN